MMKVRVNNCCGCCDLHTGTLIVGICGIFFSIMGITTDSTGLDEFEDDTARGGAKAGIVYSYIYIIINALLIYGTIKESRYFLLPWLIYVAIGLGVFTLFCLIFMFFLPLLIIGVLISGGFWYVWVCVLSYYHELNPTTPPPASVYPGATEVTTMAPTVVTYVPQPPEYMDAVKGPIV